MKKILIIIIVAFVLMVIYGVIETVNPNPNKRNNIIGNYNIEIQTIKCFENLNCILTCKDKNNKKYIYTEKNKSNLNPINNIPNNIYRFNFIDIKTNRELLCSPLNK